MSIFIYSVNAQVILKGWNFYFQNRSPGGKHELSYLLLLVDDVSDQLGCSDHNHMTPKFRMSASVAPSATLQV